MDWLLGFACFGAAWACGLVADHVQRQGALSGQGRDIVAAAWFLACFLAAGFFLSRAAPCAGGCFT
jgi:hypothetical protein